MAGPPSAALAAVVHEGRRARQSAVARALERPGAVLALASGQDVFPSLDHDWDVPAFQRKPR